MKCSRCNADAVKHHGDASLCGRCAVTADWQALITSVQDARVETPVAGIELRQTA